MSKFTLVAVVRNEAPYILEWLAHHLAVGADEFVLCVHGSSDGTAKLTRRLAAMGYAAHLKIAVKDGDPVASALAQVAGLQEIKEADWIGLLTIDQFLNVHVGHGGFDNLTGLARPTVDAIEVMPLSFGSGGAALAQGDRITTGCVHRESEAPTQRRPVRIARTLEALRAPNEVLSIKPETAQVNQYAAKSLAHLATRLSTPLYEDEDHILSDWIAKNQTDVTDDTIRRYDGWFEKYAQFLRSDRNLRLAQKGGENWHKSRADAAHEAEPLRDLLVQASLKSR